MSNLVGHFVSSPREREKRDRRGDEIEGQGRKMKMKKYNVYKNISPMTLPAARIADLVQLLVGRPGDIRSVIHHSVRQAISS